MITVKLLITSRISRIIIIDRGQLASFLRYSDILLINPLRQTKFNTPVMSQRNVVRLGVHLMNHTKGGKYCSIRHALISIQSADDHMQSFECHINGKLFIQLSLIKVYIIVALGQVRLVFSLT